MGVNVCVLRLCSVSSLVCGGGLWTKNEACSSLPLVGLVGDFVFVFGEFGEYTCAQSFISMCTIVGKLQEKVPEAIFCQWLSWKRSNTRAYQVSLPYIAWFASLRSEEVVIGKSAFFVDGCNGNNEIHMRTKFHLHVHHSWQV